MNFSNTITPRIICKCSSIGTKRKGEKKRKKNRSRLSNCKGLPRTTRTWSHTHYAGVAHEKIGVGWSSWWRVTIKWLQSTNGHDLMILAPLSHEPCIQKQAMRCSSSSRLRESCGRSLRALVQRSRTHRLLLRFHAGHRICMGAVINFLLTL